VHLFAHHGRARALRLVSWYLFGLDPAAHHPCLFRNHVGLYGERLVRLGHNVMSNTVPGPPRLSRSPLRDGLRERLRLGRRRL
jgi:hypothetical protein